MRPRLLITCVLLLASVPALNAAPFQNGSFEIVAPGSGHDGGETYYAYDRTPTGITGWTVAGPDGNPYGAPWGVSRANPGWWLAPDGYHSILLSWMLGGSIGQTFDTIPGGLYRVDFKLAGQPSFAQVNHLDFTAPGVTAHLTFDSTGKSASNMGWVPQWLLFTATASSSTITFSSWDGSTNYFSGPVIDDVTVTDMSPLISIGAAKKLQDEADAHVEGIVTAAFTNSFYLEAVDRSSGIRVELPGYSSVVGSNAQVNGRVRTLASKERYLAASSVVPSTGEALAPFAMVNKSVGGGNHGSPPQGQVGVEGGVGLNNIGLLVRTTGRVTGGQPALGSFLISDGSCDPVEAVLLDGSSPPPDGNYVSITGISSCSWSGSRVERRILVTSWTTADAGRFELVQPGKSAVIVLGAQRTSVERHAADELVKYVEMMCGVTLAIIETDSPPTLDPSTNAILIGRPETNPKIMDLRARGLISLSQDYPGLDGFIIHMVVAGETEPKYLVLGGSVDRGTTYAVYHLLEKILHIGFFEDGEYVPQSAEVVIPAVNIAERPIFEIRSYPGPSSLYYTAAYWLSPEWDYESDFFAKKKQNLVVMDKIWSAWAYMKRQVEGSYNPPVTGGTFLQWTDPPCPADAFDANFTATVHNYIRTNLGLQVTGLSGGDGIVSPQFVAAHPEFPYIPITWIGGGAATSYIDPRNTGFTDYVANWMNMDRQLRGADRYFWQSLMGAESSNGYLPEGGDVETSKAVFRAYATGTLNALKSFDPQGIVHTDGWGYMYRPQTDVRAFIEAFPYDSFVTSDTWGDAYPAYTVYCDPGGLYYYGKKWMIGTVHSFGGDECMFGALQQTIDRYKNILLDPRAVNCIGAQFGTESFGHNPIFRDLVLEVSWNPNRVTLEGQLRDIALRRYGSASASALYPALDLLAQSVYSSPYEAIPNAPSYAPRPVYRRLLYDFPERDRYATRAPYIPKLRQAVEIMLTQQSSQSDNQLYKNDLVDICKQYVAELMNYHFIRMYDAFKTGNSAVFEESATYIGRCFGSQILILSSNSRFYLDTEIQTALAWYVASGRTIPTGGSTPYLQCARLLRQKANPAAEEYAGEDRLELVKYYYRQKMQTYISVLRDKLSRGDTSIAKSDLYDQYMAIRDDYWASDTYNLKPSDIYSGTVAQAAAQVLANLASVPQPQ